MPLVSDITKAIEDYAPLRLQEEWDNSGLQTGSGDVECTGVLLCVDPTEEVIREAEEAGMNLVISHHPLLFKGLKRICGDTPVERAAMASILYGVSVYSAHTSMDNAPGGVSARMASMLKLRDIQILEPLESVPDAGTGAIGTLEQPLSTAEFASLVKATFDTPVVRCSSACGERMISRVAMCGGAGAFLLPRAIELGADAFICSDTRYHEFSDFGQQIFIADIGHFESEHCITSIFYEILREKFPTFAVRQSMAGTNPITYL